MGSGLHGKSMRDLNFADDISLLGSSKKDFQEMMARLKWETAKIRLYINAGKTKIMQIEYSGGNKNKAPVMTGQQQIEEIDKFSNLGSLVVTLNTISCARSGWPWLTQAATIAFTVRLKCACSTASSYNQQSMWLKYGGQRRKLHEGSTSFNNDAGDRSCEYHTETTLPTARSTAKPTPAHSRKLSPSAT